MGECNLFHFFCEMESKVSSLNFYYAEVRISYEVFSNGISHDIAVKLTTDEKKSESLVFFNWKDMHRGCSR